MKLLAALSLLVTPLVFAQTGANLPQTQTFTLNQFSQSLSLEQKDFQTIYRTDQVPDTCYRSEVQGTVTQCHTEYDRSCHTDYRQECSNHNYPVCHSEPRQSCSSHDVCTTTNDSVCNSHGCVTVPRRSCHTQNSCSTHMENVCHSESRRECSNVPYQSCQNIPRQVCQQVPNVVQVPYACTKPVQVPIGQQLTADTKATVNVDFANFSEMGPLNDSILAQLASGSVTLRLPTASTSYLYQVVSQERQEQVISAIEKQVTYHFVIQATSIQKLNSFLSLQITNPTLYMDHLDFTLSGAINVPFKGHLKIVQRRILASDDTIIDSDFKSNAVVSQGSRNTIMFNNFGIPELKSKKHFVTLNLGIDLDALQSNLINPEAIFLIQNNGQPITSESSGFPQ